MRTFRFSLFAAACFAFALGGAEAQTPSVQQIVDLYAKASIADGFEPGISIALVIGPDSANNPMMLNYGLADIAGNKTGDPLSEFQIGSVTKVFTSNLLAQMQYSGGPRLTTKLGDLITELQGGFTNSHVSKITIAQLANFSADLPALPPRCQVGESSSTTGCIPNARPNISLYTAQDFSMFFRTFNKPKKDPPFAYSYSNVAYGLIGLLLGDLKHIQLTNDAIASWEQLLRENLVFQLSMANTGLTPCCNGDTYQGYTQATARAVVDANKPFGIKQIKVQDQGEAVEGQGGGYASAPSVVIRGGGGSGAVLTANLDPVSRGIQSITINAAGSGYIAPPQVEFTGGGAGTGEPTRAARGSAIVQNGSVVGVLLLDAGDGYASPPTVHISGGRKDGADATLTAAMAHGQVSAVNVTNGGAGYVDPLTVVISGSGPVVPVMPIWATAGALWSNAKDMAFFIEGALLRTNVNSRPLPPGLTAAFAEAETPSACGPGRPIDCATPTIGMGWVILPGAPKTIGKTGDVTGFATQVLLMPEHNSGIIVMTNSTHGNAPELARQILFALYYAHLLPN